MRAGDLDGDGFVISSDMNVIKASARVNEADVYSVSDVTMDGQVISNDLNTVKSTTKENVESSINCLQQ
jgi:hypothetical protein